MLEAHNTCDTDDACHHSNQQKANALILSLLSKYTFTHKSQMQIKIPQEPGCKPKILPAEKLDKASGTPLPKSVCRQLRIFVSPYLSLILKLAYLRVNAGPSLWSQDAHWPGLGLEMAPATKSYSSWLRCANSL